MNAAHRARLSRFARPAAVSFTAGLTMGSACWALGLNAPAPTTLGLVGLLGVGIGERVATAFRSRLSHRRSRHRPLRSVRSEKTASQTRVPDPDPAPERHPCR
ncbi:DUF1427 family protein [Streptomyces sp. Amel2xC10]|uniref:DUF1427 family protein n=1 Tax=Streptomyces sp. Amel2xC10 TaxID=1305826 RepID=UPI000A158297